MPHFHLEYRKDSPTDQVRAQKVPFLIAALDSRMGAGHVYILDLLDCTLFIGLFDFLLVMGSSLMQSD